MRDSNSLQEEYKILNKTFPQYFELPLLTFYSVLHFSGKVVFDVLKHPYGVFETRVGVFEIKTANMLSYCFRNYQWISWTFVTSFDVKIYGKQQTAPLKYRVHVLQDLSKRKHCLYRRHTKNQWDNVNFAFDAW
jgi:hypothetical protein